MDRKHCVLFYSKNSQESFDLFNYINGLPIDLPSLTGMTMICADNELIRSKLLENKILDVPVLLIEYFISSSKEFPKKQKLFKNQIYQWIDEITKKCIIEQKYNSPKQKSQKKVSFLSPTSSSIPNSIPSQTKPKDVSSMAAEIAKQRDIEENKLNKNLLVKNV